MHTSYLIVANMYNFKSCIGLISRIPITGTDGDHIALLITCDLQFCLYSLVEVLEMAILISFIAVLRIITKDSFA